MPFTQGHALIIGIGSYQYEPRLTVSQTARDAAAVAAVLQNPQHCGYPQDQVTLLHGAAASRDGILTALDRLKTSTTETDTVVVFYSGHGEYGADGYYLTTADTRLTLGKVQAGTGVRERELLDRLQALPTKRALLVFNACHAGALSPDALGGEATPTGEALPETLTTALLATGEGRVIISACKEGEKSYYDRNADLTLFAQTLVAGLQGRDIISRRGYISAFDLYQHVFEQVSSTVTERWGLAQHPELTIHKGIGALAVALYQGATPGPELDRQDRPPALGGATREVDPVESRRALQQIQNGQINLAAGRDIRDNTVVGHDQFNLQNAPGANINPTGPINQHFGNKEERTINTGGGGYVEGDDNRRGIFGGSFNGPAIGNVEGGGVVNIGNRPGAGETPSVTLQTALDQVKAAVLQAQQSGGDDLADDLEGVVSNLELALKAEARGDTVRRQAKLSLAQADLRSLVNGQRQLQGVAQMLDQLQ